MSDTKNNATSIPTIDDILATRMITQKKPEILQELIDNKLILEGYQPIISYVVMANCETAKRLLQFNVNNNRKSRPSLIQKWKESMLRGEWRITGESIKFNTESGMFDGKHRLSALSLCPEDLYVPLELMFGFDPSTIEDVDGGLKRDIKDVLEIHKITNASLLSRVLKELYLYEETNLLGSVRRDRGVIMGDYKTSIPTKQVIWSLYQKHIKTSTMIPPKDADPICTHTILIVSRYLISLINEEKSEIFFDKLYHGISLTKDDPIHLLRHRLLMETMKKNDSKTDNSLKTKYTPLSSREIYSMIFKTWNFWSKGKKFPANISKNIITPSECSYNTMILPN